MWVSHLSEVSVSIIFDNIPEYCQIIYFEKTVVWEGRENINISFTDKPSWGQIIPLLLTGKVVPDLLCSVQRNLVFFRPRFWTPLWRTKVGHKTSGYGQHLKMGCLRREALCTAKQIWKVLRVFQKKCAVFFVISLSKGGFSPFDSINGLLMWLRKKYGERDYFQN